MHGIPSLNSESPFTYQHETVVYIKTIKVSSGKLATVTSKYQTVGEGADITYFTNRFDAAKVQVALGPSLSRSRSERSNHCDTTTG